METPPVEGKFFCHHVARDVCDLVELIMEKKTFHKTTFSKVTASRHRGDMKLFEYYSCKRCFVSLRKKASETRDAEDGGRHEYKVKGSRRSYGQRGYVYSEYLGSYHAVRDEIGFTLGSGYEIDTQMARTMWLMACSLAYAEYYYIVNGSWPSEEENKSPYKDWFRSQKQSVKLRLLRMAKAELASLDYEKNPKFHRRFGLLPSIAGSRKCAVCGTYLEKGSKNRCRFCRKPRKRSYVSVRRGVRRLVRRDAAAESRRERRAEQFENDGRGAVVSGMIEEKGRGEVFSELREDYGRGEALRMMKDAGAGKDELEDYYEDMDPCEREEIERNSR